MKKVILGLLGIMIVGTMTACSGEILESDEGTVKERKTEMKHEHCTRVGNIDGNSSADLNYEVYYTGDVLNKIESSEKVTSTESSVLDEYENAYRQIHSYYKGLDHYETNIIRTSTSVESKMIIDYDNINIQELIEIEGEEDNIFEDGVPKVKKYLELAEKVGMKCSKVS